MPPGPAYNWLCVLYTTAEILSHAARHRAAQIVPRSTSAPLNPRKRQRTEEPAEFAPILVVDHARVVEKSFEPVNNRRTEEPGPKRVDVDELTRGVQPIVRDTDIPPPAVTSKSSGNTTNTLQVRNQDDAEVVYTASIIQNADTQTDSPVTPMPISERIVPAPVSRNLQSSKVPSSRIGRLFHYGGLAASLGYGAASEILRRTGSGTEDQSSSVMMTEANIKRLVLKLSQMRGAALKLGQFMSIQDTHVLPADIDKIFRRVQDSAHYMPDWQMEQVMTNSFGSSWSELFVSFDRIPFAAASIGQVHTAILAAGASPTGREEAVAVKIQFPNIVNSIASDLGYVKFLLTAGKLLPKGLFLDKTIQVMKDELADECDYVREASFLRAFGSSKFLGNDPRYKIPWVWEGSTSTVLVMEKVNGVSVGEADVNNFTRRDRDDISAWIIELCLRELFEFRAMQTDPNWTNFLWNPETRQIELVDFGATRTYSKEFMDMWLSLLQSAVAGDREACTEWSLKLGYLTGEENQIMLDAHVNSMTLLATPFKPETPQPFSFGQGTPWAAITNEIRAQIPVMLKHRLTPPPRETYSLNRKLSGSFLLASRLGASIDTRAIWDKVVGIL